MVPSPVDGDHREEVKLIWSFSVGRRHERIRGLSAMPQSETHSTFRFGDFELDVAAYELRRRGKPVRLERQPMDLLILLAERQGRLVSREDIVGRLWDEGVFVDVETGVNTDIRKVRQALKDSPDSP